MVTVVMTTCKRSTMIVTRAVNSVAEQTYRDWELIVVDDSPDDFSERQEIRKQILNSIPKEKITYIFNDENKGACYSRNVGLDLAKGEYIAFLDDDDEWLPQKLQEQINAFNHTDSDVAMVYGPFYAVNERTDQRKLVPLKPRTGFIFHELLHDGNFVGGMSMPMMKTNCVREAGGFDNLMQSAQDYDLWLRIAQKYKIEYMSQPLVKYYIHGGEQITGNPAKKIQGLERINAKYQNMLNNEPDLWYQRNMIIIPYYIADHETGKALSVWWQGAKKRPMMIKDNMRYLFQSIKLLFTRKAF